MLCDTCGKKKTKIIITNYQNGLKRRGTMIEDNNSMNTTLPLDRHNYHVMHLTIN